MLVLMSLSGRDWAGVAGSPGVVSCAYQRPPDQPYLTEPLLSTTVLYGKGAPQSRGSQGEQILVFSSSIPLALFSSLSPFLPPSLILTSAVISAPHPRETTVRENPAVLGTLACLVLQGFQVKEEKR